MKAEPSPMNEVGTVASLDGKYAEVRFKRQSMCKHCGACIKAGPDEMMVRVLNTEGARVGDRVAVAMGQGAFMEASLLMYGVPLLALLAGLAVPLLAGVSEYIAAAVGVVCAVLAFAVIKRFEPKISKNQKFQHRMAAIVERAEEVQAREAQQSAEEGEED